VKPARVEVTRPDKELWPGVTKRDYVAYLGAVADDLLPWLRGRPLTLVRAPDGVGGERYFQKAISSYAPDWIRTVEIPAPSARRHVRYVVCDDLPTLEWLGNQAALELHPAPVRADRLQRPDLFVVDVDPPEGEFDAGVEVVRTILEVLADVGLETGIKTTGGKGLHVVAPVERRHEVDALRAAAARLTSIVAARRPGLVTDEFRKRERRGRVLLDPSRNAPGATLVAPYSPRARANATVSFPIDPDELGRVRPEDLTLRTAVERLDGAGPRRWRALADARPQRLPAALLGR
jgi:bifunctional non-homologous end joining protein LigD